MVFKPGGIKRDYMLFWVYIILAFVCAAAACVGFSLISVLGDIWIPVVIFLGVLLVLLIVHFVALSIACMLIPKRNVKRKMDNFFRYMALETLDLFFMIVGLNITVEGKEKLPKQPFLLVSNHVSNYDPLVLMTYLREYHLAFISKKENGKIPILGKYMIPCGCLFLDREDTRSAVGTINEAAEFIRSGHGSMGICPEGTRNFSDEVLLPFHAGSFKIATKAKCPLVIAVVKGTKQAHQPKLFKTVRITVEILEVLSADEVCTSRTADLSERAEKVMYNALINQKNEAFSEES